MTFPAALPAPYPNPSVQQTVTVNVVGTASSRATRPSSWTSSNATNAVLAANRATGTILNDDPQISISDVERIEGNGGEGIHLFVFTVSVIEPVSPTLVQADWITADGSALAGPMAGGGDYFADSGTVDFPPGIVSQTVTIQVHGEDLLVELRRDLLRRPSRGLRGLGPEAPGRGPDHRRRRDSSRPRSRPHHRRRLRRLAADGRPQPAPVVNAGRRRRRYLVPVNTKPTGPAARGTCVPPDPNTGRDHRQITARRPACPAPTAGPLRHRAGPGRRVLLHGLARVRRPTSLDRGSRSTPARTTRREPG